MAASGAQEDSVIEPHSPLGLQSGKRSRVVSCITPSATSAWPNGSDVSETRSRTSCTVKRRRVDAWKPALRKKRIVHRKLGARVRSSSSVRACWLHR